MTPNLYSVIVVLLVLLINLSPQTLVYTQYYTTGEQEHITIDLYPFGAKFNLSGYDVIVGLINTSRIANYTLVPMNYGGLLYYLVLNPVSVFNNDMLNPFMFRSVRLLFNRLIDRGLLGNLTGEYMGRPVTVPAVPGSPSYGVIRDVVDAFNKMSIQALRGRAWHDLLEAGAYYNRSDGYWYYRGRVISVRVVHKPMDPLADSFTGCVVSAVRRLGFRPILVNASYPEYINYILNSDPSRHDWDILPMTCRIYDFKYSMIPAYLYSSWRFFTGPRAVYLPKPVAGSGYVNTTIDTVIKDLLGADLGSRRWLDDYRRIVYLGLIESELIPIVYYPVITAVRSDLLAGNPVISPERGILSPEDIELGRELRIAVITNNRLFDNVERFTVYSSPEDIPYSIITWFTEAPPLIPDNIYGDPRGYGVRIVSVSRRMGGEAYILDYARTTWAMINLTGTLTAITLNITGLRDPIDDSNRMVLAKALSSIYLAAYITNNPDRFPDVYRVYRRAYRDLRGIGIEGSLLTLYYPGNKSLPEIMWSINTLLKPAAKPLGLIAAAFYPNTYQITPGFDPLLANLIIPVDSGKMAQLVEGLARREIYSDYRDLYVIDGAGIIDYTDWNSSLTSLSEYIEGNGFAWISNGRYIVVNATDTHVELSPAREPLWEAGIRVHGFPRLFQGGIDGVVVNNTLLQRITLYIESDSRLDNSYMDILIGYILFYNNTPVYVDTGINASYPAGVSSASHIIPTPVLFSTVTASLLESSWINRSQTLI